MEIASTGPQSLRSEYNTDTEVAETSWVTGTENLQSEVRLFVRIIRLLLVTTGIFYIFVKFFLYFTNIYF